MCLKKLTKHTLFILLFTLLTTNLYAQDKCNPPIITNDCKYIAPRLEGIKMTAIAPMCKCVASCSDCTDKANSICRGEVFTICSGEQCGGLKDCTPPPGPSPSPAPCTCTTGKCYKQVAAGTGTSTGRSACGTYECGTREAPRTCSKFQCVENSVDCYKWEFVQDTTTCGADCPPGTTYFCTPPNPPACPNEHCQNTMCQ